MAFDDDVRVYLEALARASIGSRPTARHIDDEALRSCFLSLLRVREQEDPGEVERLYRKWNPLLELFARYLEKAVLPAGEGQVIAERALYVALGQIPRAAPTSSQVSKARHEPEGVVERLELQRLLDEFEAAAPRGEQFVAEYALENRLTRSDGKNSLAVTGLGQAFLRLRGKDAVRWLLTVETVQSRGRFDTLRTPRQLLVEASADEGINEHRDDEGERYFPFADQTLERLRSMDVLWARGIHGAGINNYSINPNMRDVVQVVIDRGPWHFAIAALLEDERALVLRTPLGATASESASDQARLVAHEVRNALVPVRHHVDSILANPTAALPLERLEAVRRGVVRTLTFVDQMVTMTEVTGEVTATFELVAAIREALSWLEGGERVEIEVATPAHPTQVQGQRSRLMRALINVLLNALQSAPPPARVRVATRMAQGTVQVLVDDGGPGIPIELRARVFEDGFTTRAGGSGFGLAFARRVVEDHHGKVWCEESALGGARFVIAIPVPGSNP